MASADCMFNSIFNSESMVRLIPAFGKQLIFNEEFFFYNCSLVLSYLNKVQSVG